MPVVSPANLVRYRTTRHITQFHLLFDLPDIIWTARVDGAQSNGATSITVKTVNQVRAPAKHYQVWFGTVAGARDLGEARFGSYGAPTLYVSPHHSDLPNNAYVTVNEVIPPQNILPYIDINTDIPYEDATIAYTNQNLVYGPIGRIGCPAVAAVGETINFFALQKTFSGATIASHSWDIKDGTVVSGATNIANTALAPLGLTFATVGRRYLSYTCTDSNGKSHTRYVPVYIGLPSFDKLEISGMEGSRDANAWVCSIKILHSAREDQVPSGAMVVIYSDDYWNDTDKASIGGYWQYRENIKYVGYVTKGTLKADPNQGFVQFDVQGVGGIAHDIYGPAFSLDYSVAPTNWHEITLGTYSAAIQHLLVQHSTLSFVADVNLNLIDYFNNYFDFSEGTLASQLSALINEDIDRQYWGSTSQGMIYFSANPQVQPVVNRPTTAILTTTLTDFKDEIDLGEEELPPQTPWIDFAGFDGVDNSYFSLAPKLPIPNATGNLRKIDNVLCLSQAEANTMAGLVLAHDNAPFKSVVIQWRGAYTCFDPFVPEPIKVNLPSALNRRGIVWTNQVCWVTRVTWDYQPGVLLVSTTVEKDSSGPDGVVNPDVPSSILPPVVVPPTTPPWVYPPVIPPWLPPGTTGAASLIYNIGDGYNGLIALGTILKLLCITAGDRFKIRGITGRCDEEDVEVDIYINAYGSPSIRMKRVVGGVWWIWRYDGSTGGLISTWTAPTNSPTFSRAFAGADILLLSGGTVLIQSEIIAGANNVNWIGWNLRGALY